MPKIKETGWSNGFKRAFHKRVIGTPCEGGFAEKMRMFAEDPFDARLKTHKLGGRLEGLWAFAVAYDCRVIFKFLPDDKGLLIDIGTHDEVY
jgi:mRNA-degrading endonuclease YafQ of YafQ-DinJ toxin-antitoxin module